MPKYPLAYYKQLPDEANDETEEMLDDMLAEIESVYGQAYNEMHKKAMDYLAWFVAMDAAKRLLFNDGKITKKEYQDWRQNKLLTGMHWLAMTETLSDALKNADNIAYSIINDYIPAVYSVNGNWVMYQIEKTLKINTSFELIDEQTIERLIRENPDLLPKATLNIPLEQRWNKQNLQSAVMQSILQGESVDELADRLAAVSDMNQTAAVRNAKTMVTSAQNGGRQDSYEYAESLGIELRKMWLATLDYHTRASHRHLDGEVVNIHAKFSNGLMEPGDPNGAPEEVYNCRCRSVSWFPDQQPNKDRFSRLESRFGTMTYDEWKAAKGNEKPFKVARNKGRDKKMYKEYKDLMGRKAPQYFSEFRDLKYNKPGEWAKMKSAARKARNDRRRKSNA